MHTLCAWTRYGDFFRHSVKCTQCERAKRVAALQSSTQLENFYLLNPFPENKEGFESLLQFYLTSENLNLSASKTVVHPGSKIIKYLKRR